jgi:hypothetical protein
MDPDSIGSVDRVRIQAGENGLLKRKNKRPVFRFFLIFILKNLGYIRSRMAKKRRYERKEG